MYALLDHLGQSQSEVFETSVDQIYRNHYSVVGYVLELLSETDGLTESRPYLGEYQFSRVATVPKSLQTPVGLSWSSCPSQLLCRLLLAVDPRS